MTDEEEKDGEKEGWLPDMVVPVVHCTRGAD